MEYVAPFGPFEALVTKYGGVFVALPLAAFDFESHISCESAVS